MSEALKPCPFCGCDAALEHMGWPHHVYCTECGAKVTSTKYAEDGEAQAIAKWNERIEEKPRVMDYDELEDTMADRAVWYEGFLVGVPSLCIVLAKSCTEDAYRIVDFVNEKIRLVTRKTYGGVWRCWTARPTDAQREAVPWN